MIEVDAISKKFGDHVVLNRLSLTVESGELFVMLGTNGVGKTTLLRCLAGLYLPYEGHITIDGLDRQRDHLEIRRFTAWLPDRPILNWLFSGRGWLEMVADLYHVAVETRERQIQELLEMFDLTAIADRRLAFYSNGQTKKLALAAMLVTNARLYLMDEPFSGGVDPPGLATFKEVLHEIRRRGDLTVVMSTQVTELAEQLASRVGILHQGKIVACGTPDKLYERYSASSLEEVLGRVIARRPGDGTRTFLETFAKTKSQGGKQ